MKNETPVARTETRSSDLCGAHEICRGVEFALNSARMSAESQIDKFDIVLVDDDEAGCSVTAYYLRKFFPKAQIRPFFSAEEALAAMESRWPQAIVTDYRLPAMSGIEFVRAIRTCDAHVPIVMVSGMDSAEKEALAAGASVFLPTTRVNDLGRALEKLL
jgi:CheY-like chemotaxis protein